MLQAKKGNRQSARSDLDVRDSITRLPWGICPKVEACAAIERTLCQGGNVSKRFTDATRNERAPLGRKKKLQSI